MQTQVIAMRGNLLAKFPIESEITSAHEGCREERCVDPAAMAVAAAMPACCQALERVSAAIMFTTTLMIANRMGVAVSSRAKKTGAKT